MSKTIWWNRSNYAWGCLFIFLMVQGVLVWLAKSNPAPLFPGNGRWETRDAMMAISMGFLLLAAVLMHSFDVRRAGHGWGFLAVYFKWERGRHQEDEQKFIGPVLTAESIRAAMTAVLLAILIENRTPEIKTDPNTDRDWHAFEPIYQDPAVVLFLCVIGALALSLVTTLVGLLCYEYATKFVWRRNWPKEILLRRGHRFSTWGFYCLMWSLAVVPALLDYQLAFFTITVVFVVMWLYYFLPIHDGLVPTARLVILYNPPSDSATPPIPLKEHIRLAQNVPNVRCVEMSKAPPLVEGDTPQAHPAVGVLSFESMEALNQSMGSEDGEALSTRVTAAGATLLRLEDEEI